MVKGHGEPREEEKGREEAGESGLGREGGREGGKNHWMRGGVERVLRNERVEES